MNARALQAYLTEHDAAAQTVTRLVERRLKAGDAPSFYTQFRKELAHERRVVATVQDALGPPVSTATAAVSTVTRELIWWTRRATNAVSPQLSELNEYELIYVGIAGKLALWRALSTLESIAAVSAIDFKRLTDSGQRQQSEFEKLRLDAFSTL